MSHYDAIVVGSGINSLVCAGVMAQRGKKVLVLEREAVLGGCIRTEALTAPGYLHDTMSTAHPLFVTSPGYAELKDALHANGLAYGNNDTPTGVLLPDGRSLILGRDRQANIAAFAALHPDDGAAYAEGMAFVEENAQLIFALLGNELWSSSVGKMMLGRVFKQGAHKTLAFFGPATQSARAWLQTRFQSELSRALLAPWVLHTGLGPESPMSALMAQVICFSLEGVGLPFVKGGNARTVDAFRAIVEGAGGAFETGVDVAEILVSGGKAQGVRAADGREFTAKSVICNVTPTQLYGRLLGQHAPDDLRRQARDYRYGKGNMQIHVALSEPLVWNDPKLNEVLYLHLTPGLDGVSRAVNEAERGLLPAEGTICVAQPCAVDPSRAPDGGAVLWIQLPECPRQIRGDAAGTIVTPASGEWTEAVTQQYAQRILDRLAVHAPNLKTATVATHLVSPADLERMNINLVGGDPYSGECAIDQYLFWRPLRGVKDHGTPIKNLYHIGASTHPGPGLGGVSGFHVANSLAKR